MASRRNRMRVYIAGPMTNGTGNAYNMKKIHAAVHVYLKLIRYGYVPHCPHLTVFADFLAPGHIAYDEWLELDMCYIDDCDVVLRLMGDSVGADRECAYAKSIGKPVVHCLDKLLQISKEISA